MQMRSADKVAMKAIGVERDTVEDHVVAAFPNASKQQQGDGVADY